MTDEELRAHFARLHEAQADTVRELAELRRLVEHPSAEDRAARLVRALAANLDADDTSFDKETPFAWARDDFELARALEALALDTPGRLGYWLRERKRVNRDIAGYRIRYDDVRRLWWLEASR